MKKYRIEYRRSGCTGPGICTLLDPSHFKMAGDGLADLIGGKMVDEKKGLYILEVEADEEKLKKMLLASRGCPSRVIGVIDVESGEKIS